MTADPLTAPDDTRSRLSRAGPEKCDTQCALRPVACVSVYQPLIDITSPWSRTYSALIAPLHRARRTILGPFRCFGRARQVFKARRMSAIERSRSTPAIHSWSSQTQHYSLVPSKHYSSPSSHPNKFLTKQLSPRASNASTRHNRPMAHWHKGARMVSDAQAPPKHCRSQAVSSLYW